MTDLSLTMMSGATAMVGLAIVSLCALKGWSMLMDLRRHEIDHRPALAHGQEEAVASTTGSRIELADLRERVRKLEAIAAGVDL